MTAQRLQCAGQGERKGARERPGRRARIAVCSVLVALAALASGCTGSAGPAGPAGSSGATGPAGPSGSSSVSALNISTATTITATITSVTVPATAPIQPVVQFTLVDQIGEPLKGLTAADISFAIAKLVPPGTQLAAIPPQTIAPTPQTSAQWQSYIYSVVNPAPTSAGTSTDPVTGTTAEPQATTESGSSGTFVDNGDGTYQYTFKTDLSSVAGVSYDPTLVHRVGFEVRGVTNASTGDTVTVNSPVYTFEPSDGATSGFDDNAIVDDATCLQCHQQISFHGGARTEIQYCVLCHNPSSFDPSSGNTIDFKVMFHKIHMGVHLPSVQAGTNYYIFGHGNSINDYSSIVFPTDTTNGPDTCSSCHNQSDTNVPDTVNWQNVPSIEACGSCHDNVNFATGANHSAADIGNLTDNDCATCHGPDSTVDVAEGSNQYSIAVASAHTNLVERNKILAYSEANFAYNINSINLSGTQPTVTFTVTNPSTGQPWNILTGEPFTHCSPATTSMAAVPSWPTTDYTNASPSSGFVAAEAQPTSTALTCQSGAGAPTQNSDGSFTATLPALPSGLAGSMGVSIQGFPAHDFGDGLGPQEMIVPSAIAYAGITDTSAVARRAVVDVAKCDNCHQVLVAHGNHRVDDVQVCVQCHNPDATDLADRQTLGITAANAADGQNEEPLDFKYMIHALHDGNVRAAAGAPYVVYSTHEPGGYDNFTTITPFPGALNNCLGCHEAGTYYPQDPASSTSLATTVVSLNPSTGKPFTSPAGETAITPDTAVCSSCHVSATDMQHMEQNGGSFTAIKNAASEVSDQETCVLCHGQGATADVGVVHNISAYQE